MGSVHDQVSGDGEITVTSTPVPGERGAPELQKVALTVRRADWHAITQRIELPDAEYELTELLDETVDRGKVDPTIFGEPGGAHVASIVPPRTHQPPCRCSR